MVGNVQWSCHAPTLDLNATHENPIRVHSQSAAAPSRSACWIWRGVTLGFEKFTRVDTLLPRERVEVAENNRRQSCRFRFCGDNFELGQLSIDRRVWIDMRVEESQLLWSNCDRSRHRQFRTPLTLVP